MKTRFNILFFALTISFGYAQTFQKYIKSVGNPAYAGWYAHGIGYDPATSTIFIQADQYNGSDAPAGLIKVDTCGNVLWARYTSPQGTCYGSNGSYYNGGFSVINRTTGSSAGGLTTSILNYNANGVLVSTSAINTNASSVIDLHLAASKRLPNGDIIATGYGPVTNHFKDMYLCRLNQTGNLIWGKYSGQNDSYWENGWGCDFDPITSDCYFVGQNISFTQTNSTDIHIVKTDINGTVLWMKNIATAAEDVGWCVKVLPNQDVVIIATTKNNVGGQDQISFVKLSASGTIISSCKYVSSNTTNIIRNVNTLPNGNLLLTGYTNSYGAGGLDGLLMEVDLNGNIIWQRVYGSPDNDSFFNSVIVNNFIFTAGARDFGNTNGNGHQLYLVKTKLDGTFNTANCNISNASFVKTTETYAIFNTNNITVSGLNYANTIASQGLNTSQTVVCGKPTASFTPVASICMNQTISLVNQSLGAPNSWTWTSTANNISTPFLQNQPSITFTAAGTYTIQLKVSNCIDVDSIKKVIVVNPNPVITPTSNGPLCVGATLSLGVAGTGTYAWTGPSGFVSNLQNPTLNNVQTTNTGVYSVSLTNASGCVSNGTVNVLVNTNPTPVISTSGSNPICAGNSLLLQASGALNYTWFPGSSITSSISVTPSVNTTYTVLGSNSSSGCTNTAIYSVLVNPKPSVNITGNAIVCNGVSTNLTANGASSYLWSSGSTLSSIVVTPSTTSIYSVIGTNAVTNCTNSAVYTVSVNPNPILTISGNTAICIGQSTTLQANGASTYLWNTGAATSTVNLNPVNTSVYSVTGINSITGCSATTTQTVAVNALPIITISGNTTICNLQSTSLTASGANTYLWSTNAANASVQVNPSTTMSYSVTGTNALTGCSNTASVQVTVNPLPVISINGNNPICASQSATISASGASSYLWNTFQTSASIITSPSITTTYSVIGTNAVTNCSNSAAYTVSVNPNPILTITGNTTVCNGQSTTLQANGASSYQWNTGASTATINLTPANTAVYSVSGINSITGCSATISQTVVVNPLPIVTISGNTTICNLQSTTLTANGANSYVWNTNANSASIAVNPNANNNYAVIGTNALTGCSNTASVQVTVNPLPAITISGNSSICVSNSTTLTATGAGSYAWSTFQTSPGIIVSPNFNTVYSVVGTDANTGCQGTATFAVNVYQNPVLVVSGNRSICQGQSTTLNASGANSYTWNVGAVNNSITVSPTTNTTYSLIGSNTAGCLSTLVINVNVSPIPVLTVSGNTTVCAGEKIALMANGASTYVWSNNETSNTINYVPASSGILSVTGANTNGCSTTLNIPIQVNPVPVASFYMDSTFNDCSYNYYFKGNFDNSIKIVDWYVNGALQSNAATVNYSLGLNKTEEIKLTVTNTFGCSNSTNKTIYTDKLYENTIYAPNAFTPNGDGLNDTWKLVGECFENETCSIYNRWGELVHTLKNKEDSWDGMFKGQVVQDGVYVYKLTGNFYNKKAFEKTGVITVYK